MPNKQPTAAQIMAHIADPFKYAIWYTGRATQNYRISKARQNRKTRLLQVQCGADAADIWYDVPRFDRVELLST